MVTGEINIGDSEKLELIIDEKWDTIISFDSLGGNYNEGIKISRLFTKKFAQTIVESGNSCISACAIAFLGGTYNSESDLGRLRSRSISPSANLAFHAPYLNLDDENFNKKDIESAFDYAINVIVDFITFSKEIRIDPIVAARLMKPQRDKLFSVDNISKLGSVGVALQGEYYVNNFTPSMANNLCLNGWIWERKIPDEEILETLSENEKFANYSDSNKRITNFKISGESLGAIEKAKRTIIPILKGPEGSSLFCIIDHGFDENNIAKIWCRGLTYAYYDDIMDIAFRIDEIGTNMQFSCTVPAFMDPLKGLGSFADVFWALVPPNTQFSDLNSKLKAYEKHESGL